MSYTRARGATAWFRSHGIELWEGSGKHEIRSSQARLDGSTMIQQQSRQATSPTAS